MKLLTIGISGASCSGKTSVASMLEKVLPWCSVINQDKYYHEEDSCHHVRSKNGNLINWEVLSAFNMKKMKEDISIVSKNLLKGTPPCERDNISYPGLKSLKTRPCPVLIIEGIVIFKDQDIVNLCEKKYFVEIDHDTCQSRRQSRVWDPEGDNWVENSLYFESIAWPEYLDCIEMVKRLPGVNFLDSTVSSIDANFELILTDIVDTLKV